MAKTLANIRTLVRANLDEISEADWSNDDLDSVINSRYQRVYANAVTVYEDYKVSTDTDDFEADTQEYSLPTDLFKLRRVEVNYDVSNSNSIAQKAYPVNMDAVRTRLAESNLGTSILRNPVYYIHGTTIGFLPIPTSAGTAAIKYWYIPVITDLSSDSSEIDIPYPDRYYYLIVDGAAADALRFGQQESYEADKLDRKFEQGLLKMQEELEDRIASESKAVLDVDPIGSFEEGWY